MLTHQTTPTLMSSSQSYVNFLTRRITSTQITTSSTLMGLGDSKPIDLIYHIKDKT